MPGRRSLVAMQVVWLAYRDFVHERRISICFVLALMAVLAPLLVLFGLKFGLIDTVAQRLVRDPHNTELIGIGSGRYDTAWFEAMQTRPEVMFVMPNTRRIAAGFALLRNPEDGAVLRGVQMIPTKPGDPLLAGLPTAPSGYGQVVLSHLAAQKLGLRVGGLAEAHIERRRDDRVEGAKLALQVIGIAPEVALPAEGAFVSLELLIATEDYRDGLAVAELGWSGEAQPSGPRFYPRFRLYARSIYEVGALSDALMEAGVEVRTKTAEIESMQLLDRNLSRVFWLIAGIGGLGFLTSLGANLLANVDRKRRELSVLRLIGFPTWSIVLVPLIQATLIALLGVVAAVATYAIVAEVLNIYFQSSLEAGELICRLLPGHFAAAFLATMICAVVAASWAGYRASQVDPAEGIRDV